MPLNLEESEAEETLEKLIGYHTVDIWIGAIGSLINVCLLTIFFSKRVFFRLNMILVILALGDFFTCMGIMVVGLSRKNLYSNILRDGVVPVETSWSCALKAFVWLRLLGSILPSATVLWIGVERLLAVLAPVFYRDNLSKKKARPCIVIILYTLTLSILAFCLAFSHKNQPAVYYCGRKAAFTNAFSTYIYVTAIAGYIIGLGLNLATFITLCKMYAHRANISEISRQLRILRYVVLISMISTIAVIIPNIFSLFTAFYGRMNITISESGSWLLGVKSSVNIFIYLVLKTDFRNRVFDLFGIRRNDSTQLNTEDSIRCKKQPKMEDKALISDSTTIDNNDKMCHKNSFPC